MKRLRLLLFLAFAVTVVSGCGSLRYSETLPEAKDFHPKAIGILPADVSKNEEARGVIDKIVADDLLKRKWFDKVVSAEEIKQRTAADQGLGKNIEQYLAKLEALNFSDPELSQKIGDAFGVDAILIVKVDYWLYTKERDDKVAKAGLDMKLISTGTGNIQWKAGHHEARSYTLFKPELTTVARTVAHDMLSELPR